MESVLRQVPLFSGLTDDDWAGLAERIRTEELPRGADVFREGEPGTAMHVVVEGKVKITRGSTDVREGLVAVLGPGDLFGELSLFDGEPRTASATTVTDATIATLVYDDVERYLVERPTVSRVLLRVLAQRLRATNAAMADLVFTDVPGRVAKALLSLSERFGEDDEGSGVRVSHDLTQEELAQLVGASRETVNKALSDFATRGWLRVEGRGVVILDAERLAKRAR